MTPAARLSAAIEVLAEIFNRHQPSTLALKEWGRTHRFAGSSDRAIIGNLVFDVLRRKGSLAWLMQSEEPRALVLALYAKFWINIPSPVGGGLGWGRPDRAQLNAPLLTPPLQGEEISNAIQILDQLCSGENHAPAKLTDDERNRLSRGFKEAPPHVRGFYPEWLDARLAGIYGEARMEEGAALAERAPIDLRVNTLKATRDKVLNQLQEFQATVCEYSPFGIRIPYGAGEVRSPHIESEGVYQRGYVELQDEGSQLVSQLVAASPGEQVLDLCAGGGGKTLALAALMENKGQIVSTDRDKHRLAPIYERIKRAGTHNVQVRSFDDIDEFKNRIDKVVLDVPCTGTGAWRRRPDNKWRLTEKHIADRTREQDEVLAKGAEFVREGGELVYMTCSILRDENENRVQTFLASDAGRKFKPIDMKQRWQSQFSESLPRQPEGAASFDCGLRFSPQSSGTDGFYITVLQKYA
jgi:16S rRNA (cytosine967-C5)-methyltransferase